MTLAEYLAEVRARVEAPPSPMWMYHYPRDGKAMLAIIEEQAKALEAIHETASSYSDEPQAWEIAHATQARIDALIAKGEK